MGIKDLWTILQPFSERKSLQMLHGERVAIDLSGWVCQAQHVQQNIQPRMYLRNLFFRTCFMLLHDIHPVFALEGPAPMLKLQTLRARHGGKQSINIERKHFIGILRKCSELLEILGVKCVQAAGEAEALCAHLNRIGVVAGCISQDSDCFAYGATRVYRNFSVVQTGEGSVDVYDLSAPFKAIGFGRDKALALALLCGSDYNDGVPGVGRDTAMKLFAEIDDADILARMESWQTASPCIRRCERKPRACDVCTHRFSKVEAGVRHKALGAGDYFNRELLDEFRVEKPEPKLDGKALKWGRPDVRHFVAFAKRHLQWEEVYSLAKVLPLLGRWLVKHGDGKNKDEVIKPRHIKKTRNPKGIPSFEIVWNGDALLDIIPQDQITTDDMSTLFVSIEPQHDVCTAYPELVAAFEATKTKKGTKAKKARTKTSAKCKKIDDFLVDLDASTFGDENDDLNLSDIVQGIINQPLPELIREKIAQIRSCQFMNPCAIDDPFEMSVNQLLQPGDDDEDVNDEDEEQENDDVFVAAAPGSDDEFAVDDRDLFARLGYSNTSKK